MAGKPDTYAALLRLAGRIEYGHLLAETQPVQFLDNVGAELDRLRTQLAAAERVIEAADGLPEFIDTEAWADRTDAADAVRVFYAARAFFDSTRTPTAGRE